MKGLTDNYVEMGKSLNLSQFHHAIKFNLFLTALLSPFADIQAALSDLLYKRHIDTAEGRQLDGIGDIVGVARPYVDANNNWYFGFTGQSKSKGFSQAPIRDAGVATQSTTHNYMSDMDYRALIQWKIVANNSHGTTEDIIRACITLYRAKKVEVKNLGGAEVKVIVTRNKAIQTFVFENKSEQWIPVAVGVGVTVEFVNA